MTTATTAFTIVHPVAGRFTVWGARFADGIVRGVDFAGRPVVIEEPGMIVNEIEIKD